MEEKEHDLLDSNPGQKPDLLVYFSWVHFSSEVFIMRIMWSHQVDKSTLKGLISVHKHRSELICEIDLKKGEVSSGNKIF